MGFMMKIWKIPATMRSISGAAGQRLERRGQVALTQLHHLQTTRSRAELTDGLVAVARTGAAACRGSSQHHHNASQTSVTNGGTAVHSRQ